MKKWDVIDAVAVGKIVIVAGITFAIEEIAVIVVDNAILMDAVALIEGNVL